MSESDAAAQDLAGLAPQAFEPLDEGEPFGDMMNAIPKYVVSTSLTNISAWRNSTLLNDNVVELVRALKARPGNNIGNRWQQRAGAHISTARPGRRVQPACLHCGAGWRREGVWGWAVPRRASA
jgi:hypothetical protein